MSDRKAEPGLPGGSADNGAGQPGTLPDLLRHAARTYPTHGIGFIKSGDFFPFPETERMALAVLAGLQARGIRPGDRVILSLERSREIIPVLWGCFLGGIVPALLQPPVTFTEYNPAAEKTEKVFDILREPYVIVSNDHREIWHASRIPPSRLADVARLPGDPAEAVLPAIDPGDLAMIQFSSGSTGDPKGVMLTHRNILLNTADIIRGIALHADDISVNWMPLYHDMGLIGFHITPVFAGVTQYFIDPVDFVKNPAVWLDALTRKRCTITACPNFGQVLVNRYLLRRGGSGWDLSTVRILFNGAEPISVPAMNAFLEGLKPFCLDPLSMFPAYGLAEATLAVTFPPAGTGADVGRFRRNDLLGPGLAIPARPDERNAIELVNLGKSLDRCHVRVTGDDSRPLPEQQVGNIQVRGGNVTSGYYGSPASTEAAFEEGWLRTGDLGFLLDGDLYVTGRAKDIIFVNGMNHYAHDLELLAVREQPSLAGRIVVAGWFDADEGRDRLLVFLAGIKGEEAVSLCREIRNFFSTAAGIQADLFLLIRPADIPRTSSGKIRRFKMVEKFQKGEYPRPVDLSL